VKSVSRKDLSDSYSKTSSAFDLKGDLFIDRQNNSMKLYVSFDNNAIKYELNEVGQNYFANYSIELESYSSFENAKKNIGRKWNFEDSTHFGRNTDLEWKFIIDTCDHESRLFLLRLTDNHLQKSEELLFYDDYTLSYSDFMLLDLAQDPLYTNIVEPGCDLLLFNYDNGSEFRVAWLKDKYEAARAPFIHAEPENPEFDTVFLLDRLNDSVLTFQTYATAGTYYIIDEDNVIHYNIHAFNVNSSNGIDQYKEPLKYISTKKEYRLMEEEERDPLYAVERFWLDICSDNDAMARNLSESYYNNVEIANLFFSSYKSGWKTDRGIIYIVMGKPTSVFVSDNFEEWTYGDLNDFRAITLVFKKEELAPGIYDYILERNPGLKHDWYLHAEKWRK
jgi:GWxTD domain-containing protein